MAKIKKIYRNSDGELHRLDGPAVEYDIGDCIWCVNGKLHRDDGPAGEFFKENVFTWWLNNINYSFKDWCSELNKSTEEINFLKLKWNIV